MSATTAAKYTPEKRKEMVLTQMHRVRSNLHLSKARGSIKTWHDVVQAVGGDRLHPTPVPHNTPAEILTPIRDWLGKLYNITKATGVDVLFPSQLISEEIDEEIPEDFLPSNKIYEVCAPQMTCTLYKDQMRTVRLALYRILVKKDRGGLLQARTGEGKTFVYGCIFRYLANSGELKRMHDEIQCVFPTQAMIITRSSIVEKTRRDMSRYFGFDTDVSLWHPECLMYVTSVDQIRSEFGERFMSFGTKIIGGEAFATIEWRKHVTPAAWVWDECHVLKNVISHQAACHNALNEFLFKQPASLQIFSSATPIQRVGDAKYLTLGLQIESDFGYIGEKSLVTPAKWNEFAIAVAAPSDPADYNAAAVERFTAQIKHKMWPIKGGRWQFKARNKITLIDFNNDIERETYNTAWKKYQEELAMLDRSAPEGQFAILAMFIKFRQAAELIRAPYIARQAYEAVNMRGHAFVGVCEFKATIARILWVLINDYGVSKEQISLIWGGIVKRKVNEADKVKLLRRLETFKEMLTAQGMRPEKVAEFAEDFAQKYGLKEDSVDQKLFSSLGYGQPTRQDRQDDIDKFQSGKALYAFLTFKAGGAGLSLHHTDEMTKEKCRRDRDSNYAILEDIPLIPMRPRETILTPVYSAIEMVQGLGRAPRRTSLSDTDQQIIFYRGTVEEEVASICKMKMKCISKATMVKEDWHNLVGADREEVVVEEDEVAAEELDEQNMEVVDD